MKCTRILFLTVFIVSIFQIQSSFAIDKGFSLRNDNNPFDAVVEIKGTGNYKTIQDAIDHVPSGRNAPWLIFIKNGRYEELIRIPIDKPFIHLIGQNRDSVIITYKINCSDPEKTGDSGKSFSKRNFNRSECATVVVDASDFYAENICFENAWGVEEQKGPQALAIKTNNDRFAFFNCKFRSFQDTWMTSTRGINDRTYAANCWIEGAVDYFYGGGNAYIENSTLYNVRSGSVIVAPSHRTGTKWGYVFDHCIIDGNAASSDGKLKLGRPWHNQPIAIYLNTIMKVIPHKEGWTDMGPAARMFAEYNSRNDKGMRLSLSSRRTWYQQSSIEGGQRVEGLKSVLTRQEAKTYNYKNIILADDGWNPRAFYANISKPIVQQDHSGTLHWKKDKNCIGFVIYLDGKIIGFTSSTWFETISDDGEYQVQGVNKFGSLGAKSNRINKNMNL